MFKLSLFPLNAVLFPGTPLSLHIFEDRYKLMIGRCIEAKQPFGVVLIRSGAEVQGMGASAKPYLLGCTARIVQVQPLDRGRMNINIVGMERFQVRSFEHTQPYLIGEVEPYPLKNEHPEALRHSARRLWPWVERYLSILEETEKLQVDLKQLPHDSLALTYYAAALLKTPLVEKQALLAAPDAERLVAAVRGHYRKEVTLLKAMLAQPVNEQVGPFSLN